MAKDQPKWSHQRFAQEIVKHGDRVKAAKAAGSRSKNLYMAGSQLLQNDKVQALILALRNKVESQVARSVGQTKADVHALIDEAIVEARLGIPIVGKNGEVVLDHHGDILRRPDIPGMLKGAELKGKTVAMFANREIVENEMAGKTDAELEVFFLAALLANPMLLEKICSEEVIQRKVHELERRHAASGEGNTGASESEAESVSPSPEAGSIPSGRVH